MLICASIQNDCREVSVNILKHERQEGRQSPQMFKQQKLLKKFMTNRHKAITREASIWRACNSNHTAVYGGRSLAFSLASIQGR